MRLIEHDRLLGNLYFVEASEEVSGFSGDFVRQFERIKQKTPRATSFLVYEEAHAEGPLRSVFPIAMDVERIDDWLDEIVEIFADSRGFFLEDHEAEKVAE